MIIKYPRTDTSSSSISEKIGEYDTSISSSGSILSDPKFISNIGKPDITIKARQTLSKIEDPIVRNTANQLLYIINLLLQNYFADTDIPAIKAQVNDDGSVNFEWPFLHFRVGFNIELKIGESGWYIVSDDSAGSIMATGKIFNEVHTEKIVLWLLEFIILNY